MKYDIYVKLDVDLKRWMDIDIALFDLDERGYVKVDTIETQIALIDIKWKKLILTKDRVSNYWIIKVNKSGGTRAKEITGIKAKALALLFGKRQELKELNYREGDL